MTYTNGNSNGHNGHAASPASAATRLRKMLTESNELIVMPGVYDGFSARIALEIGFDGLYMVSALIHIAMAIKMRACNVLNTLHRRALEHVLQSSVSQTWALLHSMT
jgi:hypothetical protein